MQTSTPTQSRRLSVPPQAESVVSLPGLSSPSSGVVEAMALSKTTRLLAGSRETASFSVVQSQLATTLSALPLQRHTLWTGLTIQLILGSRRIALWDGSTRM